MAPTVVEKRNPLSSDARRSGWVGSYILLDRTPEAGRIGVVERGQVIPRSEARATFERTAFLSERDADARCWPTAVMDCIDELDVEQGERFELADVYAFEDRLSEMYPDNNNVRPKIRQQLQVLRDEGLIEFLGNGEHRLRWVDDRGIE